MQPAAVLVDDIRIGEINDGRMVQEKGKVGDQQRVGRLANGTQPGSGAIGWLAGGIAGREIRRGVLVHPIADFPRVPVARISFVVLPMVLQHADRTAKHADGEITRRRIGAGVEGRGFNVFHQQRFEVVSIGVIPRRPGVGQFVGVVVGIEVRGHSHLFEIAFAESGLRLRLRPDQRRQKQPGQDGDDRNDDQQFD